MRQPEACDPKAQQERDQQQQDQQPPREAPFPLVLRLGAREPVPNVIQGPLGATARAHWRPGLDQRSAFRAHAGGPNAKAGRLRRHFLGLWVLPWSIAWLASTVRALWFPVSMMLAAPATYHCRGLPEEIARVN